MNLHDSEILKGIKQGDIQIFDLVFKHYYLGLYIFARDYLKSSEAAEEVVQELFLYVWENREKLQIKTSLKAYLYRAVHNRCMNYIRDVQNLSHRKIQLEKLRKQNDLFHLEIPETIFDQLFSEQMENDLHNAIESLPDQCRRIFRMSRFENLTYPQIAKHLNVSLSTVKTQMSRAMNALRQKLEKYF